MKIAIKIGNGNLYVMLTLQIAHKEQYVKNEN